MAIDLSNRSNRTLGVFSLAMINVIAVDSLRSIPAGAEYGLALISFYLLAALFFFIPTALISAELATAWPNTGGAYIWIRTAFGQRIGFFAIWLQWIYNVVWYPTILSFIAATLAYLIDPKLVQHKGFVLSVVLITWWLVTILNSMNLKVSSRISTFGALIGTLIPMLVITILGVTWLAHQHPTTIIFSTSALMPNFSNVNHLTFLTTIIFGLMGLEMSAVHAGDVRNPQRDYPRALLLSAGLILTSLILASLAVALVIPPTKLSVLSGLTDAYIAFFDAYHLTTLIPIIIALIIIGSFCSVSTWVIGPTRGLLIAARETDFKKMTWLLKVNKHEMPVGLLILQGVIVTLLCSIFILMPSVNAAYWLLGVMTSQLAFLFYLFFFAAALRLRYKEKETVRAYHISGGKFGIWLVCGMGMLSCIFTFSLGFLPPPGIDIGNITKFETTLIIGDILFCIPPFLLNIKNR